MSQVIAVHCRYTSHHFAIKKVVHGIVGGLFDLKLPGRIVLLVNKNNLADFERYKSRFDIVTIPVNSDAAALNHLFNIFLLPFVLLAMGAKTIVFPQISFFVLTGVKTVVFIHDLIEYKIRNQRLVKHISRHIFFPWVSKRADLIVTVSGNSKKDIVECLSVDSDKVLITYDGVDHILPFIQNDRHPAIQYVRSKFGVENYALYVGYLTLPQKNLLFLLQAFRQYVDDHNDESTKIVFVGPKGKDHEVIFAEVEALNLSQRFLYLGTLSEEDLAGVYQAASVFCFPSLYEGFGMPVAEAMACGCPVISSNRSSLPEVVGSSGVLVDPGDVRAMVVALNSVLGDKVFWKSLSDSGILNSKRFTWRAAAESLASKLSLNH